jgi:hypothetical protein
MTNPTQPLTSSQARELAQEFHDIGAAIGTYRLAQVGTLSNTDQFQLQNLQLQCVQFSNSFVTLGLFAQQADLAGTLQTIKNQTAAAQQAISAINTVNKVLQIASAAAVLGASIASMNPSAVATGVQGLVTAISGSASPAASTNPTPSTAGTPSAD